MAVDLSASITSPTGFTLDNGTAAGKGTVAQAAALLQILSAAQGSVSLYDVNSAWRGFSLRGTALATNTATANNLLLAPAIFTKSTISEIGIEVTTAGAASSKARIGLYGQRSGGNAPGALIVDSGEIAVDSTGHKFVSVSLSVQIGLLYWAAIVSSGSPSIRISSSTGPLIGWDSSSPTSSNVGLLRSFTYDVLPSDESAQTGYTIATSARPTLFWR